ncbi:unnamed protein product, partial [Iphiclides podalirius]
MRTILFVVFVICSLALEITSAMPESEEIKLEPSHADVLEPQESKWGWGGRRFGGYGYGRGGGWGYKSGWGHGGGWGKYGYGGGYGGGWRG